MDDDDRLAWGLELSAARAQIGRWLGEAAPPRSALMTTYNTEILPTWLQCIGCSWDVAAPARRCPSCQELHDLHSVIVVPKARRPGVVTRFVLRLTDLVEAFARWLF